MPPVRLDQLSKTRIMRTFSDQNFTPSSLSLRAPLTRSNSAKIDVATSLARSTLMFPDDSSPSSSPRQGWTGEGQGPLEELPWEKRARAAMILSRKRTGESSDSVPLFPGEPNIDNIETISHWRREDTKEESITSHWTRERRLSNEGSPFDINEQLR